MSNKKSSLSATFLFILTLVIIVYLYFQDKINKTDIQSNNSDKDIITEIIAYKNNTNNEKRKNDFLELQISDLNNQLINTRNELEFIQQKLIISVAKIHILEDELNKKNNNIKNLEEINKQLSK